MVQTFFRVILFGTDIDTAVPHVTIQTRKSSYEPYVATKMPLSKAIGIVFDQGYDTLATRLTNPIWSTWLAYTGAS